MLREFEVKIPLDNLEHVENKLRKLGAILIGYREEHDYYIDTRPCIDIVSTDSALRIRVSRDPQSGNVYGELTFKGPRENHGFAKVRKEMSVEVNDPLKMLEIFKALGFNVFIIVSKKRKVYQYNEYKVYLDDVEGLGKFVEIEYMYEGDRGWGSDIDQYILEIVDILGLPKIFIKESYLELMMKSKGENRGC
jgi:adenylate cyclase class 2